MNRTEALRVPAPHHCCRRKSSPPSPLDGTHVLTSRSIRASGLIQAAVIGRRCSQTRSDVEITYLELSTACVIGKGRILLQAFTSVRTRAIDLTPFACNVTVLIVDNGDGIRIDVSALPPCMESNCGRCSPSAQLSRPMLRSQLGSANGMAMATNGGALHSGRMDFAHGSEGTTFSAILPKPTPLWRSA
jgi:hypothetical protein